MEERKSKLAAGLLGIFLGAYGIHNFYLGYTTKAIIQLVVSIVSLVLGTLGAFIIVGSVLYVGILGMGIWGFVEGILILCGKINTDAKGIPLKE